MAYTHLDRDERYQIHRLHKAGFRIREIAELAERHPSTIHRELRRNSDPHGRYNGKQAHRASMARRHAASSRARIDPTVWESVQAHLRDGWSPEQIARASEVPVSVERIISTSLPTVRPAVIYGSICAGANVVGVTAVVRRGSVNAFVADASRNAPKGWTSVGVLGIGKAILLSAKGWHDW